MAFCDIFIIVWEQFNLLHTESSRSSQGLQNMMALATNNWSKFLAGGRSNFFFFLKGNNPSLKVKFVFKAAVSLTTSFSSFSGDTLSWLTVGCINHSGFLQKIFCGGDYHMRETKCPLWVTAQVPLISCQIIQNAANPLNLSTGRKKFPHPRERIYEFLSITTNESHP